MAGMLYHYFDGYLRMTFRNGPWSGDIEIVFNISGDTISTTPCDDKFVKGQPNIEVAEDVILRCWTSASVSNFFFNMISWLEAVTCDVKECAFYWDGEGPDGELRWHRGSKTSGMLYVSWSGRHNSPAFEHKVRLDKTQMVRAMYQSFRDFVESEKYDPISYERLRFGEVFALVLIDESDSLVGELAVRDRHDAYALVQTIMEFANDYERGYPRRAYIAEFIRTSRTYWKDSSYKDEVNDQLDSLFDKEWNNWTIDQRRSFVKDELFMYEGCGGYGESLRTLRSQLVESWLTTRD